MIEFVNIKKSFEQNCIFENVSFCINKGDCVGIIGSNGCGKSVLLKLMCGFVKPDSGEIIVNDKKIGQDCDFIDNAGVIINSPNFMMHMNAFDNLKLLAEIRKKINNNDILEILKLVRLDNAMRKKVKTFSQGMLQRLRIAQAFMEDPEIIILDEPMNYLDKDGKVIINHLLEQAKSDGKTIVFTSHNLEDLYKHSNYFFKIDEQSVSRMEIPETLHTEASL